MAERTNARLLKSREVQASVGSNPTPSAQIESCLFKPTAAGPSAQKVISAVLFGRTARRGVGLAPP